MRLVCVLHVARGTGGGRAQKSFNHFAANSDGMSVLAFIFRYNRPDVFARIHKSVLDLLDCFDRRRWTVHQRDDWRITPAIQNIFQTDSVDAELSLRRIAVAHQKGSLSIHNG